MLMPRDPNVMVIVRMYLPTGESTRTEMTQRNANGLISIAQEIKIEVTLECNNCGNTIEPGTRYIKDHSGRPYCGVQCWDRYFAGDSDR